MASGGRLGKNAHADAAGEDDLSVVRFFHAGRDAQQRGFSRTVDADEADLIALVDGEGQIGQQGIDCIGFGYSGGVEQDQCEFLLEKLRRTAL